MNEMTDTGQIALPATQADITALFSASDQVDALIERIEKEVRSHAPDLTTAKGRKAIASLAAKVSKSKTALDGAGKNLNAGYREKIDAVDAERRKIRDRLDALRDEARKPLTDWEKAEEDRKARMRVKVDAICIGPLSAMSPSQDIKVRIAELESVEVNETWAEFQDEAAFNKDTALTQLRMMLEASEKREADERELARLRAEAAEREAKERAEREAREKAEREERVRREAKEAEARRVAEEKTRQEQIARAAAEAAEQARIEAEARAAREKVEAEARHKAQLAAAEKAQRDAVEAERQRVAKEKAEAEAREAKRAANKRARAGAHKAIVASIEGLKDQTPAGIATAIMDGRIANVAATI